MMHKTTLETKSRESTSEISGDTNVADNNENNLNN